MIRTAPHLCFRMSLADMDLKLDWRQEYEKVVLQRNKVENEAFALTQQLHQAEHERNQAIEHADSQQQQLLASQQSEAAALQKMTEKEEVLRNALDNLQRQLKVSEQQVRKSNVELGDLRSKVERSGKAELELDIVKEEKKTLMRVLEKQENELVQARLSAAQAQPQKKTIVRCDHEKELALLKRQLSDALKNNARLQESIGEARKFRDDEDDEEPGCPRYVVVLTMTIMY